MDKESLKEIAKQLRQPQGDGATKIGEAMNDGNRFMNLNAISELDVQDGECILEIGMGNGFFVKNIFEEKAGVKYIGCDFSEDMIKQSTAINSDLVHEGKADFRLSNAESMPVDENSVDKILTINTVYFWENKEEVLSQFRKVLKPNGRVVLSFRPKEEMVNFPMTQYGFNMFAMDEVADLFLKNGFDIVSKVNKVEPEREVFGQKAVLSSNIIIAEVQ